MLIRCPTCSAVYSKASAPLDREGFFTCTCGTPLTSPEGPKETVRWKLRNRIGEALVCGLAGALLFGTFSMGWRGDQWVFGISIGVVVGLIVGAIFGDRFLEWVSRR